MKYETLNINNLLLITDYWLFNINY
jgi:hypothetical protein